MKNLEATTTPKEQVLKFLEVELEGENCQLRFLEGVPLYSFSAGSSPWPWFQPFRFKCLGWIRKCEELFGNKFSPVTGSICISAHIPPANSFFYGFSIEDAAMHSVVLLTINLLTGVQCTRMEIGTTAAPIFSQFFSRARGMREGREGAILAATVKIAYQYHILSSWTRTLTLHTPFFGATPTSKTTHCKCCAFISCWPQIASHVFQQLTPCGFFHCLVFCFCFVLHKLVYENFSKAHKLILVH